MRQNFIAFFVTLAVSLVSQTSTAQLTTGWKAHDLARPAPKVVTPSEKPGGAPSDAIVLFDGTDMSNWRAGNGGEAKWKIVDGAMESVPKSGFVYSKEDFGDCQVHLEFASPAKVKGNGQGRGNSGVFLMGKFEIQVLDSFDNKTYADGSAGSLYGQYPPEVNVSRKPGEWQTFDIIFKRPRFAEDGKLESEAQLTVLHNGVLIQNAVKAFGPTSWIQHGKNSVLKEKTTGPLSLQDHGNPVRYKNIWVRRLEEKKQLPEQPYDANKVDLDPSVAEKLAGRYGNHKVELNDGKFILHFSGNNPLVMVPHSKTEYGFTKSAGKVTFELDDAGNATGLVLELDAAGKRKAQRKK